MVILEILMVLIGLGAVIYSFRLVEEKKETEQEPMSSTGDGREVPSIAWEEKLSELRDKVEALYEEVDDKMSRMSNEKIMGMSEYSDQVLDKIEKNHGEVVFLYDMMNAKQEEIKQLVKEIDGMKADLHDEAAGEFLKLKEQEKLLQEIRKEIELDALEYQSQKEEIQEEWEALKRRMLEGDVSPSGQMSRDALPDNDRENYNEETEMPPSGGEPERGISPEEDGASSIFDAEIARIEEAETKALLEENGKPEEEMEASPYQPLSEQEKPVNHNDEIIALYKKGRSILDISKMLALGQGEVKFVIDLYNAR